MVQKDNHKVMAIGISIFLSLMLWIYVMGEKNPVQTRVIDNVKVSLENTDNITRSNLVLLPKQDFTISISITGRVKDLIGVRSEELNFIADMSGYLKKGDNDIPVIVKSLPNGINISDNELPKVKVKLDTLSTRFVPVRIISKGTAKVGYEHINPITTPTGVMISGPKSYVDEVEKAVGRINIEGSQTKFTKTIPVEPINSEGKIVTNVSIEPKFVDVTVDIAPSKEVPIIVKTTGTLREGLILEQITSKVSTVRIVGSKEVLSKIKAIETESFNLTDITETVTKEIKLLIPRGVSIQSDIESVGVEVKVNKKGEKDFVVPLSITGKVDGFKYEINTKNINVKVNAVEDALKNIKEEDISCVLDVSTLSEGENTIQVKALLNKPGEISGITPDKIVVKVIKVTESNAQE
ncbi:CdaR family protein [Clostridium cylindrosporum]|uniref:YbbR-like protein n=1 Tax=Clostridium cylindrosporum DSM 605 TaxID=1121307 RepID=A0A0J8G059_CLOCY|nr:CdaR family protein [Clostridium cylindrosporum]KMT21186.1 hypothetical protein CLCY_1c04200 [Clostridium cylindrosporum DSM 605]